MMTDKISVIVFKYEVNAIYAKESLTKKNIESSIIEKEVEGTLVFEIVVAPELREIAKKIISQLSLDDSPVTIAPESTFFTTINSHLKRYDPINFIEFSAFPNFNNQKKLKRIFSILIFAIAIFVLIASIRLAISIPNFLYYDPIF